MANALGYELNEFDELRATEGTRGAMVSPSTAYTEFTQYTESGMSRARQWQPAR